MRKTLGALVVATTLGAASAARADGWITLPNGEPGYVGNLSTSGVFACFAGVAAGHCVSSGNTLTLLNGTGSVTFTFTGTTQRLTATNVGQTASLGTVTTTVSGPGVTFPSLSGLPDGQLSGFLVATLGVSAAFEVDGVVRPSGLTFGYLQLSSTEILPGCCPNFGSFMAFAFVSPNPQGLRYSTLLVDGITRPVLRPENGSISVTGTFGLVPEPSSILLLGTGIAALGGVAVRRRAAAATGDPTTGA